MAAAWTLVSAAKWAGADVAKFQIYEVDKLFPTKEIVANGKNWYEEVKKTELSQEQVKGLSVYCKQLDIEFFASAFDVERIGWLESLGVRRHKIASRFRDTETLKSIKATKKEVILSLPPGGFVPESFMNYSRVKYLYCVPEYPTPLEHLELEGIGFPVPYAGFSDHTVGIEAACVSISRGATIIEKHFTLDRKDTRGPDHICSATPKELKKLIDFARKVEQIL